MNGFFLFAGLPWPVMILFTIALVIVLIGHGWAIVLFVVGGKAVKTAPATSTELTDSFHWVFIVPALDEEVTIAFVGVGVKTLAASIAGLEIV